MPRPPQSRERRARHRPRGKRASQSERTDRAPGADFARRRAVASALRESEQRYRQLFTQANDAIVIFDSRTSRVLEANQRALQLYGFPRREFIGLELMRLATDAAEFRRYVARVLRRGRLANVEVVRRRRDGRAILVSINAAVIDYGGRRAILCILRDVTAVRRAEETVRRSEQRLRAARDASLDAFYVEECVRDARGRIVDFRFVDVNRRGAQLLSRRREDLIGHRLCELFPVARTHGFFKRFVKVVETGRPLIEVFPVPAKADSVRAEWLQQQVVRLGDGIAITARDITREKRTEEMLRQFSSRILKAQEAERHRVARDLHDGVHQLLAAARFRLQVLSGRLAGPARVARRDLAAALEAVVAATREVRRISHHLRPGELDDLGFAAAVRTLCREFARRTGTKVVLDQRRLRGRPPAHVEEAFFRIVQECLTNIERHARARRVVVALGSDTGHGWLRVADDGHGFDIARQRAAAGLGLRHIEERAVQAGGTFACESAPGRGTEIRVRLPVGSAATRF